jgi:hypothetical protein
VRLTSLVLVFTKLTFAPAMMLPPLSVTVPTIDAVAVWARSDAGKNKLSKTVSVVSRLARNDVILLRSQLAEIIRAGTLPSWPPVHSL